MSTVIAAAMYASIRVFHCSTVAAVSVVYSLVHMFHRLTIDHVATMFSALMIQSAIDRSDDAIS